MSPEEFKQWKRSVEQKEMKELEELEELEKCRSNREIENHIRDLEYKHGRIKTKNSILDDITESILSASELKHNQQYYDRLTSEIDHLKSQLK